MKKTPGGLFGHLVALLGDRGGERNAVLFEGEAVQETVLVAEQQMASARKGVYLAPELLLLIALFLDIRSLVRLAWTCKWLFHELSKQQKERYLREYPFSRCDTELHWLQQFHEQWRPLPPPSSPGDSRQIARRTKAARPDTAINWFRACYCRQQTEADLWRRHSSKRTVPMPPEYRNQEKEWQLWAATPRYLMFKSGDSFFTYTFTGADLNDDTPSSVDPSVTALHHEARLFRRLDYGGRWHGHTLVDGDTFVIEALYDKTKCIFLADRSVPRMVHWPTSNDTDHYPLNEWYIEEIRHGWLLAYTTAPDGDNRFFLRLYSIPHSRWCGGVAHVKQHHLQMATNDVCRIVTASRQNVKGGEQLTFRLWEYRWDQASERCLQSGTVVTVATKRYTCPRSFRLSDRQSAMTYWTYDDDTSLSTLRFYIFDVDGLTVRWETEVEGRIQGITPLLSQHQFIAQTRDNVVHILDIVDGTVLREVSSIGGSVFHLLGCLYACSLPDGGYNLLDAQTDEAAVTYDNARWAYPGPICGHSYGGFCAETMVRQNRLTLHRWYTQ